MADSSVINFTGQQEAALEAIATWYDSQRTQVFRLFGPAGVGKTTIARTIPLRLGAGALYGAYTGKAAYVLNRKGCSPARTLHSLIYTPVATVYQRELRDLERFLRTADPFDPQTHAAQARLTLVRQLATQPGWQLNPASDLLEVDLLICDEVSMVDQDMANDLLSFGKPIVVLGDPEQLPPIRGEGFFTAAEPDFMLTEVHRQANDSPILSLATQVRAGAPIPYTRYVTASLEQLLMQDQVLCGTNRTRWQLIYEMRAALGRPPLFPVPGDRVMCLANNRELGIFNGQQFTVSNNLGPDGPAGWKLELISDDGTPYGLSAHQGGFIDQAQQDALKANGGWRGRFAMMTFANAVTVHKAQGSEWPAVALFDESGAFARNGPDTVRRWLYTGITRAADSLTLVGGPR